MNRWSLLKKLSRNNEFVTKFNIKYNIPDMPNKSLWKSFVRIRDRHHPNGYKENEPTISLRDAEKMLNFQIKRGVLARMSDNGILAKSPDKQLYLVEVEILLDILVMEEEMIESHDIGRDKDWEGKERIIIPLSAQKSGNGETIHRLGSVLLKLKHRDFIEEWIADYDASDILGNAVYKPGKVN